jgi:hypothetical protein
MIKILALILFGLLFSSTSSTQIEENTPDLLFTIGFKYFPIGAEDILAAKALEYYDGHLYLAFVDKVLKIDMHGNVVWVLNQEKADNISDIAFYNDQLVVYQPQSYDKLTFYQDSTKIRAVFVHFYASNEKELTQRPSTQGFNSVRYIFNCNGELYFHDRVLFFPFSYLSQIRVTTHQPILRRNLEVFVNKKYRKLIDGYPISDCESVQWSIYRENPPNNYYFNIYDFCSDTISFISKPLPDATCESCKVSISEFFKNDYLYKYFFVGGITKKRGKKSQLDRILVFLDENFEVEKVYHSLEYLQGMYGPSPKFMASFTYDEFGNVYYCTNYHDYSNKRNSYVKIYKIKY